MSQSNPYSKTFIQKHDCKNHGCGYNWKTGLKCFKHDRILQHSILFKNEKCNGMIVFERRAKDTDGLFDNSPHTKEEEDFYSKIKSLFEKEAPEIKDKQDKMISKDIGIPPDIISFSLHIKGFPNYCENFGIFCENGYPSVKEWLTNGNYREQFQSEIIIHGKKIFGFRFEDKIIQWEHENITTHDLLDKFTQQFKHLQTGDIRDQEYLDDLYINPIFNFNDKTLKFEFSYSV